MNSRSKKTLILMVILIGLIALMTPFAEDILSLVFEYWYLFAGALLLLVAIAVLYRGKQAGTWARWGILLALGGLVGSVAMTFVLSALGINLDYPIREQLSAEEAQSHYSLVNSGTIAETADYVFYLEPPKAGQPPTAMAPLIRRNKDWSQRKQLTDSPVSWFFVDEDWIYFVDPMESNHLLRMDHSAGQVQELTQDRVQRCLVQGDQIFYNTADGIYQINLDGTGQTRITDESGWPVHLTAGGWLYYQPSLHKLARVKLDGTEQAENPHDIDGFSLDGETLYFFKLSEPSQSMMQTLEIYQQAEDAPEASEVTTVENVHFAKYSQGSLYYQLGTDKGRIDKGVYRAQPDGSSPEKINRLAVWQFNDIVGDWIYIQQYNNNQYRVKLDGTVGVLFD